MFLKTAVWYFHHANAFRTANAAKTSPETANEQNTESLISLKAPRQRMKLETENLTVHALAGSGDCQTRPDLFPAPPSRVPVKVATCAILGN
jgi:hypothetical protein